MNTKTYTTTADFQRDFLAHALGADVDDYDLDAITADLIDAGILNYDDEAQGFVIEDPIEDIDEMARFWDIVAAHDTQED